MIPKSRKMLIVDDIKLNRIILREAFQDDYEILQAEDGNQAMDILYKEKKQILIVMLDIFMPEKDGFSVLAEMKSNGDLCDIPVVVVTQVDEVENEVRALDLGADDLIRKPYDPRVIRQRVKNIVEKKEMEQVRAENHLLQIRRREEERYRIIVEHSGTIVFEWNIENQEFYCSEGLKQFLLYEIVANKTTEKDILLQSVYPQDFALVQEVFLKNLQEGTGTSEITVRLKTIKDEFLWCKLTATIVMNGLIRTRILGTLTIVDKEMKAELELRYRAEFDSLTGIYNKSTFYQKTQLLLAQNPDTNYTLIRFDVDRFKVINDIFGMEKGDRLLKKIAQGLHNFSKDHGTYGHLEADHFVLCIPDQDVDMDAIIEQLNTEFRQFMSNYSLIFCFGIYHIHDRSLSVDIMCDRAKLALQSVKGNYMKRYAVYDDVLRTDMLHEQEVTNEMDEALSKRQFEVFFQPIYSLKAAKPVSAEALVRWNHPLKGVLSPASFIHIFEQNGFISKLDFFVWEEVCRKLRAWLDAGESVLPVSVNMSRINLYKVTLCDDLVKLMRKYHLDTSLFKIEITESAYTENPMQLLTLVKRLQECHFTVLMDDFGSGYSSLNMLKDICVDILKIDMNFLSDFKQSKRSAIILASVVQMAEQLNMQVIAEGVETKEQMEYLRSIGCDKIQGYYYSKPLNPTEYEALLDQNKP
ncbi:MAG: EAL domain-containing protein [Hungatella sp.]